MSIEHKKNVASTMSDSSIEKKNKGASRIFVLSAIAVISILFGIFLYYWPISQYLQVNSYQSTHCTILAKKLEKVTTDGGADAYHPHFTFSVPTGNGKSYIARGYGLVASSSANKNAEQAILDSYKVNTSYSCWYAASDPTHAILSRDLDTIAFAPGTIFVAGGLFLLFIAFAIRSNTSTNQLSV
jgi:hypothetical protein